MNKFEIKLYEDRNSEEGKASGLDQHDRTAKLIVQPIKFVEDDVKIGVWQLFLLAKEYHWKKLKKLLSSYLVLLVTTPKLMGILSCSAE